MKLLRETQCRVCESEIATNVIFCKYCKRDRFLGFPQYEWLLIFLVLFGCIGSFGLAQVIPVSTQPTPTSTEIKPTSSLIPSQTLVIPTFTVAPSPTLIPSLTPQTIFDLTSTPDYFGGTICSGAPSVKVQVNDLVIVVTSNYDKLKLRSKPIIDPSTVIRKLSYGSYLKIHDGPVCVKDPTNGKNYWFWEVKDKTTGTMGWVADGDSQLYYVKKVK